MFNVMMSNSDLFDKLYQEINRQNTFYFWYISALLVIIGADLVEQCNKLISAIDHTLSSDSLSDVEKAAGMLILKNSIRTTTKYTPLPQIVSDYIKNDKNVQKYMSYSEIFFKGWPDSENSQQG